MDDLDNPVIKRIHDMEMERKELGSEMFKLREKTRKLDDEIRWATKKITRPHERTIRKLHKISGKKVSIADQDRIIANSAKNSDVTFDFMSRLHRNIRF